MGVPGAAPGSPDEDPEWDPWAGLAPTGRYAWAWWLLLGSAGVLAWVALLWLLARLGGWVLGLLFGTPAVLP